MRDDDVAYNFRHGKKIKRIYVPPAHRAALSDGSLVIVNNDGQYHLLSKAAVEQVRVRDPQRILVEHGGEASAPDALDEHYAKFKVPEEIEFTEDPLPRNPAGKLLKNILRRTGTASFPPDTHL